LPDRAEFKPGFSLFALVRGEPFEQRWGQENRATASHCFWFFKNPTLFVPDESAPDLRRASLKINAGHCSARCPGVAQIIKPGMTHA
jgi:hypothetical protein